MLKNILVEFNNKIYKKKNIVLFYLKIYRVIDFYKSIVNIQIREKFVSHYKKISKKLTRKQKYKKLSGLFLFITFSNKISIKKNKIKNMFIHIEKLI